MTNPRPPPPLPGSTLGHTTTSTTTVTRPRQGIPFVTRHRGNPVIGIGIERARETATETGIEGTRETVTAIETGKGTRETVTGEEIETGIRETVRGRGRGRETGRETVKGIIGKGRGPSPTRLPEGFSQCPRLHLSPPPLAFHHITMAAEAAAASSNSSSSREDWEICGGGWIPQEGARICRAMAGHHTCRRLCLP